MAVSCMGDWEMPSFIKQLYNQVEQLEVIDQIFFITLILLIVMMDAVNHMNDFVMMMFAVYLVFVNLWSNLFLSYFIVLEISNKE